MCPCRHVWFLFSKIYQGVELLGCRNSDTPYAQFIACRPDLFFQLLPWQLALSELPVTLQRHSLLFVLPVSCPSPGRGRGQGDPCSGYICASCEVRGVNTPRGRTFGSGMKEPVHEPHPSPSGLSALQCYLFGFLKGDLIRPRSL